MSNITITKIKGMKILSVRLVYGRRSLGIAPNVRGFAMVGLQGTNFQLITKIK
jgi:hypothetical protein